MTGKPGRPRKEIKYELVNAEYGNSEKTAENNEWSSDDENNTSINVMKVPFREALYGWLSQQRMEKRDFIRN